MMRNLFLGLFIMFSLNLVGQNDFRKMNWGDSPADLKAKYPDVSWETGNEGAFHLYLSDDYVGGLDTKTVYMFIDDKLQAGGYYFQSYHTSDNLYYEDFISISSILNGKYEMEKNENWNDTTWEGDDDMIGYALRMGNVEIEERFEDQHKLIMHRISGGNGPGINHVLFYYSMEFVNSQRNASLEAF